MKSELLKYKIGFIIFLIFVVVLALILAFPATELPLPSSPVLPVSPISSTGEVEARAISPTRISEDGLDLLFDANANLLNMSRNSYKIDIEGNGFQFLCREYIHYLDDNSMMLYGCIVKVDDAQKLYDEFDVRFIYLPIIEKRK